MIFFSAETASAAGVCVWAVPTGPDDRQMLENDVLVPFQGDGMLTINSPIWIEDETKVEPKHPPAIGQHSDEVLRKFGCDEAEIRRLRGCGAVS